MRACEFPLFPWGVSLAFAPLRPVKLNIRQKIKNKETEPPPSAPNKIIQSEKDQEQEPEPTGCIAPYSPALSLFFDPDTQILYFGIIIIDKSPIKWYNYSV